MTEFWKIVSGWEKFGQWLFFLAVIGSVIGLLQQVSYHLTVLVRGWPSK